MPAQFPTLLFGTLILVLLVVIIRQRQRLTSLEFEARHDVLTSLPNRRALAHAWGHMHGTRALILIDLVGFKAVNDSHGHIVGDALLQKVAARLSAAVPAPGLMARWGGDEFVALVPAHMAEGLQAVIATSWAEPYDLSSRGGPSDVRIGGRIGLSIGETDLERALDTATHGLMEAKAAA
jgi:diguanylate cyclase (GGDEF)-like protein